MWQELRGRGLQGIRVKRQVPFGPFILDFAVPEERLAIEVDGETHGSASGMVRDARRDEFLTSRGWSVLRFTNREVLTNLAGVLEVIAGAAGRDPHPDPLPQAGEGVAGA